MPRIKNSRAMKDKILRLEPDIKKAIVEFRKRDFGNYAKISGSTKPEPLDLDEPAAIDTTNNQQNLLEVQKSGKKDNEGRSASRGSNRRQFGGLGKKKGSVAKAPS